MKNTERVAGSPGHQKSSASISAALGTIRFPATREDLITKLAAWSVPLEDGERVPFGEIAALVPRERFETPIEASRTIDRHWADIRKHLGAGSVHGSEKR